ncbi:expressed unknown protein [Seminavis robusta]|uniref:Uncharacterized protein n=1 Tax=Seminavis robusta TaxID=568900 RepID=A0A9N8E0S5_9STRA|nr:expressed unknown protein [Seminavis robusta]|eukprot:Sro393_g133730.1 n/a (399) ;mRNA; f:63266-64462
MDSISRLLFLEDNNNNNNIDDDNNLLKDTTCTTDYSTDVDDEDDAAYYSSLFQMYDGNWAVNGHWLTAEVSTLLECLQQLQDQDDSTDLDASLQCSQRLMASWMETSFSNDGTDHDDYFYLEDYLPLDDRTKYHELQQHLQCRCLTMASLMLRCLAADLIAPPYVQICRLASHDRQRIASLKTRANEAFFFQRDYPAALQLYEEALQQFPPNFICHVMPAVDWKELVSLLASQADCYFQLEDFVNVGYLASYALVFDASHTKSLILRAKAQLALARIAQTTTANDNNDNTNSEEDISSTSLRYTIQAKIDLEQVLSSLLQNNNNNNNNKSKAEEKVARELMEDVVQPMMQREQNVFSSGDPYSSSSSSWDWHVKSITATCWRATPHNLYYTSTSTSDA